MNAKQVSLIAFLLSAASMTHAAQPVATLACVANGANVSINLSSYAVGAPNAPGDVHDGRGAGLPALSLRLNAALGSFQILFQTASSGTVMPTCTLSTVASNGDAVQFVLKSVQIKSVSAVASAASVAAPATSYVNAVLVFTSVTVVDTGGGADDGGASPVTGYDISANKNA